MYMHIYLLFGIYISLARHIYNIYIYIYTHIHMYIQIYLLFGIYIQLARLYIYIYLSIYKYIYKYIYIFNPLYKERERERERERARGPRSGGGAWRRAHTISGGGL